MIYISYFMINEVNFMTFFSEKFLQRIQYEEKDTISFEDLPTVMSQFAKHIPFENIDVMLNIDREMKAEQLYEKIIKQNRGGLCYELNPLFYYFLKNYGFQVYMISATVLGSRNPLQGTDRKSTRLNSSHVAISYAVFCLKKTKEARKLLST